MQPNFHSVNLRIHLLVLIAHFYYDPEHHLSLIHTIGCQYKETGKMKNQLTTYKYKAPTKKKKSFKFHVCK